MTTLLQRILGPICLTLLVFTGKAWAWETWNLPVEVELPTLTVSNQTLKSQILWIAGPWKPGSNPQDSSFEIPPKQSLQIDLKTFSNQTWLTLNCETSQALKIFLEGPQSSLTEIPSGVATRWKVRPATSGDLILFNLAPFEQTLQIESALQSYPSIRLAAHGKTRLPQSTNPYSTGLITITGEARLNGLWLHTKDTRPLNLDPQAVTLKPPSSSAYFRLSSSRNDQSFVVSLTDPKLIQQARQQIQKPSDFSPRILIGKVELGNGGYNRDFSKSHAPPWSWHVSQVYRFAELASQDCDGSPELVEEVLGLWVQSPGNICFWSYRIVEELSEDTVASGRH